MTTSYDQVLYRGLPFAQSHPDRMATLATLFGMNPAPVERCRVLEIGCADGGNLIPMAFDLPGSEFLGFDLAGTALAAGRAQIEALGLKNVRLERMDILDAGRELGCFDYIIAHGIYSWVDVPIRDKLLLLAHDNLSPEGVAYISYNALPGCRIRQMIRDMMLFHIGAAAEPADRLERAREFLTCLLASQADLGDGRAYLRLEAEMMLNQNPAVLYHDELSDIYHPVYFTEFLAHAARFGLEYLSEAVYHDTQPGKLASEAVAQIREFAAGERIAQEQYLDFLKCRKFRQTLLSRGREQRCDQPQPARIEGLYAASSATPVSKKPDLRAGAAEEFRGQLGSKVVTAHPLAKAAMTVLSRTWPGALHFHVLLDAAAQLTGETPNRGALCEILLGTYTAGMIELHTRPPQCVSKPGDFPAVTALARWQAQHGNVITTPRHSTIELTGEVERRIVAMLDGTRTRAALARDIAPMLGQHENTVSRELDANLAGLAKSGLFIA